MSVKLKICKECGKKVKEDVLKCPRCHSSSFKKFQIMDDEEYKINKENNAASDSFEKLKHDFDKFSNDAKKMGNDFLYDNLPKEYADKLKEDFSNFTEYSSRIADDLRNNNEYVNAIKKGAFDFSQSTRKMGEDFINENISQDSQDKIKQSGENFSNSTKKFLGDATLVLTNIHKHHDNKRKEKAKIRKKEREEKKRKKEEEMRRKEAKKAEERRKKEEQEEKNHKKGVVSFKEGLKYFHENKTKECHENFKRSFKYLKGSSPEYSAAKLYYASTFLAMTNACLIENPPLVYPVINEAKTQIEDAVKSFKKYDSFCRDGLNEFKKELFFPTTVDYFNLDFSTAFGEQVAGGWLLIILECQKMDEDYRYEKMKGDLLGRTNRHDMAVACFDEALKSPDCDFRVYGYKAQSLKAMGRFQEANASFSRLNMKLDEEISKDPENVYLLREKAITFASMGLKDRALMIYNQILEINPDADFVRDDINRLKYL